MNALKYFCINDRAFIFVTFGLHVYMCNAHSCISAFIAYVSLCFSVYLCISFYVCMFMRVFVFGSFMSGQG